MKAAHRGTRRGGRGGGGGRRAFVGAWLAQISQARLPRRVFTWLTGMVRTPRNKREGASYHLAFSGLEHMVSLQILTDTGGSVCYYWMATDIPPRSKSECPWLETKVLLSAVITREDFLRRCDDLDLMRSGLEETSRVRRLLK